MLEKTNPVASPFIRVLALLFGTLMLAIGAAVIAAAFGAFSDADGANRVSARGFATLIGSVFAFTGLALIAFTFMRILAAAFGLCAMAAFVVCTNWVAFGSEELTWTKRTNSAAIAMSSAGRTPINAAEGRIVFGVGAFLLDALVIYGLISSVRSRRAAPPPKPPR